MIVSSIGETPPWGQDNQHTYYIQSAAQAMHKLEANGNNLEACNPDLYNALRGKGLEGSLPPVSTTFIAFSIVLSTRTHALENTLIADVLYRIGRR